MTVDEIVAFVRTQMLGVVATNGPDGRPQAALVGIAVSDRCEFVFDAAGASCKVRNVRLDPHIALVIGGTSQDERTLQGEGIADEPVGAELDRIREVYFARYPGGRDRLAWAGITHVRIRPHWLRYSDYNQSPPLIIEAASDASGELVVG